MDHLSLTEEAVLSDDYQPSTSMDYMSTAPCTIGNVNVETGFQSRKRPGDGPESQRSQTNAKEESPHFDTAVKSEYDEPPAKFARVERMETGDVENAARDDSDCSDYGDEENDDVIDNVVDDSRKFKIRKFQQELSEKAIRGENTIISCETGTGKTYVAIHIIREHLKHRQNEGPKKVAFIAKTNVLVAQQKQRLEKFLPEYKVESLTREDEEALHMGSQLQYFDIFCLTPQILVNNLRGAESLTSLCQFSLLVFDECHHTMKDDPYNILMRHYLMEKSDCPSRLPNLPQVITIPMKTGYNARGKSFLTAAIKETEEELSVFLSTEPNVIDDWAKLPKEKGSQGYMTWLLSFEMSVINKVKNTTKSRNIVCCILHLYVYSAAMEVDYLLSLEEVVKYMDAQFQEENDRQEIMNDVEKKLLRRFTEVKAKLMEISSSEENPNMRQIQDILKTRFEEKGAESRGLIFVKARATCKALASWLNGKLANEGICVRPLYGKDKRGGEKGMSEEEQQNTLDQFDEGTFNVLVATSIGEEGLDIQACDFTLSYNYVKNEISTIQMAGRIRRTSGGVNIVIGNDIVIRKERLNVHKVQMMYNAMEVFKKMNKRARDNQIQQIQQREVKTERLRRRTEELRASSTDNSGNFELMCRLCPAVACSNRDIRLLGSKRIVVNRDFASRIILSELDPTLPDEIIDGYTFTQRIQCQGCKRYWGKVFQKQQVPCYVLQLSSFKVINKTTEHVKQYKKWNKVPFKPEQVEFEEICKQHLQRRV